MKKTITIILCLLPLILSGQLNQTRNTYTFKQGIIAPSGDSITDFKCINAGCDSAYIYFNNGDSIKIGGSASGGGSGSDDQQLSIDSTGRVFTISLEDGGEVTFKDSIGNGNPVLSDVDEIDTTNWGSYVGSIASGITGTDTTNWNTASAGSGISASQAANQIRDSLDRFWDSVEVKNNITESISGGSLNQSIGGTSASITLYQDNAIDIKTFSDPAYTNGISNLILSTSLGGIWEFQNGVNSFGYVGDDQEYVFNNNSAGDYFIISPDGISINDGSLPQADTVNLGLVDGVIKEIPRGDVLEGGSAMTPEVINDSLKLQGLITKVDTINFEYFSNGYPDTIDLTNNRTVLFDTTNLFRFDNGYGEGTCTFYTVGTGNRSANFIITHNTGQDTIFINERDTAATGDRELCKWIAHMVDINGIYTLGVHREKSIITLPLSLPLLALSSEVGNKNDSLQTILFNQNLKTDTVPGQTTITFNHGSGTIATDTIYVSGDTLFNQLVSNVSADSTLSYDYTIGSDSLVYAENDSIWQSLSDSSVTNNLENAYDAYLTTWWPMNGNPNDSIGSIDGTIDNATLTTDRFGNSNKAYDFNGTDAYIGMGDDDILSMVKSSGTADTSFSISFWIKFDDITNSQYVISKMHSTLFEYRINITTNNLGFRLFGENDGANAIGVNTDITSINTSNWHHVVYTYDGSGAETGVKCYLNKVETSTGVSAGTYNYMENTSATFNVSSLNDGAAYFDGKIDDIRIYKGCVLTQSNVNNINIDEGTYTP